MSSLELSIAWRYLRSRRGSKLLSFISVIAIVGVVVGVSALIVVMGVMNGLQRDLRSALHISQPITAKRMAQRIVLPDNSWLAMLAAFLRRPRRRN